MLRGLCLGAREEIRVSKNAFLSPPPSPVASKRHSNRGETRGRVLCRMSLIILLICTVVDDKRRCGPGLCLAGKEIQINYKMLSPSLTSLVLQNGTATRDAGDEYLTLEVSNAYIYRCWWSQSSDEARLINLIGHRAARSPPRQDAATHSEPMVLKYATIWDWCA